MVSEGKKGIGARWRVSHKSALVLEKYVFAAYVTAMNLKSSTFTASWRHTMNLAFIQNSLPTMLSSSHYDVRCRRRRHISMRPIENNDADFNFRLASVRCRRRRLKVSTGISPSQEMTGAVRPHVKHNHWIYVERKSCFPSLRPIPLLQRAE